MKWKAGKYLALFAIVMLLASGVYYVANAQVNGANEVNFSFITISNNIPVSGLKVNLETPAGSVLMSNVSSPSVGFSAYPGNYILNIPSQELGNQIYNYTSIDILVNSTGAYLANSLAPLKSVSLTKVPVNAKVYLNISGVSVLGVYSYLMNGLTLSAVISGNYYLINTTSERQTIFVNYYNGSNAYYSLPYVPATGNNYLNISLSTSSGVSGYVTSPTGMSLKTVNVSLYSNGNFLGSQTFSNGYFYLTMAPGTYVIVISSPGYLPTELTATVSSGSGIVFHSVSLTPSVVPQTEIFTLSQNFKSLTLKETLTITNASVLLTLPYSNAGSLYNQMKLLNMIQNGKTVIWEYMNYSIPEQTLNTILFNSYDYNLVNYSSSITQEQFGGQYGFSFSFVATYSQNLTAGNSNTAQIYVQKNGINQNFVNYYYLLNLPSQYQRANLVNSSLASVSGFSGVINISNAQFNGWLTLKIDVKEKPTLTLSSLAFSWTGYFESPIVNSSSANFTFVVPANRNFTLNASNVPYDNVLLMDNYQQMKFQWNIGGNTYSGYNITTTLSPGVYSGSLSVTDVGGNSNQTNFTIISDSNTPTLSLSIVQEGKTLFNQTSSSSSTFTVWLNQTAPVYFNAIKSKDVLPSGKTSGLPLMINWNLSGSKKTGLNVSYTFVKPTFGSKFVFVNITVENAVGNEITWTLQVHVNDTTPPVATFTIYNSSGKAVTSADEYEELTLNASKSFAPNGGYITSYNWTIYYANGTKAPVNTVYNMTNVTSNMSVIKVAFIQYGTFKISLEVTDQSNHHSFDNVSIFITAVKPELEILNVTYPKTYTQGSPATFKIELKNVGLANATEYYITIEIGGKVVKNETFTAVIGPNKVTNVTVTVYPPSSGQYTLTINVHAIGQPSFFDTNVQVTKAVSIAQAPYILPLIVGVIVIIIGILAYAYYALARRKKETGKEEKAVKKLK